jgi:hypothetical protein
MPIATLIAMRPTLQQSGLFAAQRLVGAALGAAIAAVLLVTVTSLRALEEIIILLMGVGMSIYRVNYALYTAAIAAAVLIAMDLPIPRTGRRGTTDLLHVRGHCDHARCDRPRHPAPEAEDPN